MSASRLSCSVAIIGSWLALAPPTSFAESFAIVNARAYTGEATEPIERATIAVEEGRISSVSANGASPPGARVIDARGGIVTAGLMGAGTQLGLVELYSLKETADQAVAKGPLGAAFDVQYALNANSTLIPQARADGVTRAMSYPTGSADLPFSGLGALLRLDASPDLLERPKAGLFIVTGGIAAMQGAGSRSAQWQLIRNAFDEAKRYRLSDKVRGPRDQLLNHLDAEALQPVVAGHMPLAIFANRESDIRQAVQLGKDYGTRVIVYGGAEAWRVAGLLAANRVGVVLDPVTNLPSSFDDLGVRADNAALLQKAGVTIAFFVPGIQQSHNVGTAIREGAGVAVAHGLPWSEALKAITVNPARIWGIDDHYGRIARGQDADLVLWDGDPLEPTSAALAVYVRGVAMPLDTRQKALRDRYAPQHRQDPWPPAYH
ncbi:MAG: Imidazolonepropionase [Steroidobacteraceae bacterium]|nr:Imidazolonepropionase [Steroidobacteraceae bacterium]